MITWIVSSTVLILIVILLRQIFRKKISHALQYALWLPVLFRLLIPVTPVASDFSVMNLLPEERAVISVGPEYMLADGAAKNEFVSDIIKDESAYVETNKAEQTDNQHTEEDRTAGAWADAQVVTENTVGVIGQKGTWTEYATLVWALGSLIMAAVLIGSNVRFYLRLRKARISYEMDGNLSLPIKKSVPVYMVDDLASPCLFGIIFPSVYVSSKIKEPGVCAEYVIAHELCHYKRGDHFWALLRGLCLVVWWWNPLVWTSAKMSVQDGELACDEAVIRFIGEESRIEYGHTLVNMIPVRQTGTNPLCGATSMGGSKKSIKERLQSVVSEQKTFVWAVVAVCVLVVLALVITLTGARDEDVARELTEKEKEEILNLVQEKYVQNYNSKRYDYYSIEEMTCLPPTYWEDWESNENSIAVIRITETVIYSNEHLSLGPQCGSGEWTRDILIAEENGQFEIIDYTMPELEDIDRESVLETNTEALAIMSALNLNASQYRDYERQLYALLLAKIDHDFDSYLDFTREEYNLYITGRKDYYCDCGEDIQSFLLVCIQQDDFSNTWGGNQELYPVPEFVPSDIDTYNLSENIGDSKKDLTVTVLEALLIEEGVIGQRVLITDETTGNITEMEYQFKFTPGAEGFSVEAGPYIIGGRVLSKTQ